MKRTIQQLLLFTLAAYGLYSQPNTFLATIRVAPENEFTYIIRLVEVLNDVDVLATELELPVPENSKRDFCVRVQGDQLRIFVGDSIYKQFRVSKGLKSIENVSITNEKNSTEIDDLLEYATRGSNSHFPEITVPTRLVQLTQDLFLYVHDSVEIIRRKASGYTYKSTYLYNNSRHPTSFVQYSTKKIAYLDEFGRVLRVSLDKDDSTNPIWNISNKLLDSISSRKIDETCSILKLQLDPIGYVNSTGNTTFLDKIVDTRDTEFIIKCLQSLSESQKMPFENTSWKQNPLVRIAGNGDLATARRVLEIWPELGNDSTQSFSRPIWTFPIEAAVGGGSVGMVQLLLENGVSFPVESNAPYSIYSNARSKEMRSFLEGFGYREVIDYSFSGTCNDNNVRIRGDYSTTSEILGVLKKNDQVEILGITAHRYTVVGKENVWYKVRYRDIVGWVFGQYLWVENDH